MSSKHQLLSLTKQYFLDNPQTLTDLSQLYSKIWTYDENFGEYFKCPNCGKYYNEHQVEVQHIHHCGNCGALLLVAWPVYKVSSYILNCTDNQNFFGVILFEDDELIGFCWGDTISHQIMYERWGDLYDQLYAPNKLAPANFHLQEIGLNPLFRGKGYGKLLARSVFQHAVENFPQYTGALTTHIRSTAARLYEKAGWKLMGEKIGPNPRVYYGIPCIADTQICNLE